MSAVSRIDKQAIMRYAAVARLRKAAQALLEENTECAEGSYRAAGADTLTDNAWKHEDPRNFKLCREVRNALREVARAFPAGDA